MPTLTLTISAVTNQADIRALAGNPASAIYVIVNVNAAVYSSVATIAALVTGTGWAAGSKIKIVNNSGIYGCGGAGGTSGVNNASDGSSYWGGVSIASGATPGGNGGAAIEIQDSHVAVSIDNTNGSIFGGGGGGGAGASGSQPNNNESVVVGGVGGAGRGYNQPAGAGGNSYLLDGSFDNGFTDNATYSMGGAGGDYGAAGNPGFDPGAMDYYYVPASAGGAAGKAVALNGRSVTWLAGNDANKVKGAVA